MKNFIPLEAGAPDSILALSVYPKSEDHAALRSILRQSDWPLCPGSKWTLKTSKSLDQAMPILRKGGVSVVLCERDLQTSTWKDLVGALALLTDPPYLIVTSQQADDRLWVEALNLGAYDVLQTPFNAAEVSRTLSIAWMRWTDQRRPVMAKAARSVA